MITQLPLIFETYLGIGKEAKTYTKEPKKKKTVLMLWSSHILLIEKQFQLLEHSNQPDSHIIASLKW